MERNVREIGFNVNAYTARLIGRENVSKLEGAVLEIVKNAYDADARVFGLYYCEKLGCIYVMDNGTGMSEEVIRDHWMMIGNSSKKDNYLTKKKRIQTGAKGIGRFALDRLSDMCKMYTVSDTGGLEWVVDWRDFEKKKSISDVKAYLYDSDEPPLDYLEINAWPNQKMARMIEKMNFSETGTVLRLEGLHDEWNSKTMDRLKNHLQNLLPPDVVLDFKIYFFSDDTDPDDALVISANIENYDYKISFQVQGESLAVQMIRNEFDFHLLGENLLEKIGFDKAEQEYFFGKPIEYTFSFDQIGEEENRIGNISGTLFFNKISSTENDTKRFFYKDIRGRRNLTKEFGGIKIYRDHFRVRPYGEYGDNDFDWLELSARRSRSPAGLGKKTGNWRVGAEQMLGIVNISRTNPNLEDAANRNGIQEGEGFWQLKRIILNVIQEFERDRQSVGRKLAEYARTQDHLEEEKEKMRLLAEERRKWEEEQKKQVDKKADNKDQNTPDEEPVSGKSIGNSLPPSANPEEVASLLGAMEDRQEEEIQEMQNEAKLMQTLATTGILVNMFMHEIRTLTNNIGQELDAAYEAIEYDHDIEAA